MNLRKVFISLALLGALLAACAGEATPTPAPSPFEPPRFSLEALGSLSPMDVLVQSDYEPGLMRPEVFYPFGRVPPFTLLADGTLIYVDESGEERAMQVRLSPEEAAALVQKTFDLGFQRLESHTDPCKAQDDGTRLCVSDAAMTIFRVRTPQGELRQVKIYSDFANEPEAFAGLRTFLNSYRHDSAQLYIPDKATLFFLLDPMVSGVEVHDWPLDPGWFERPISDRELWARVLEGEDLSRLLAEVQGNMNDFYFQAGGQTYRTFLVPWLPGVDYTAEVLAEFPAPAPRQPASAGYFSDCPLPPDASELALPAGRFRLVYLMGGNAWSLDEGKESLLLTSTGDVEQVRLSREGDTVLFTRRLSDGAGELWAVNSDGRQMRRLAGGADLTGSIHIISISDAVPMVAFAHNLDENNAELWVASLDGSGARRLVGVEDLRRLLGDLPEPLGVIPTGVHWIPYTFTLTYDAYPIYDAIHVYVQNQVWVVDAVNGTQGQMYPPGEGGALSFSPDGRSMALITPDRLSVMNVEGRDRRDADLDYKAVGFGEYYYLPWPAWSADSQSFFLALPEQDQMQGPVAVWEVAVDGTTTGPLSEFSGFVASFAFSPDLAQVAYWRDSGQPNRRELHIARLDGSEDLVYDGAENMDFLSWAPDSQHFVYVFQDGSGSETAVLGDICGPGVEISINPRSVKWLDDNRFLFQSADAEDRNLYLGIVDGPSTHLVAPEDVVVEYDFVVLAPR